MNPQMTTFYMAEQANRTRLDRQALRTWIAYELVAQRDGQPNSGNVAQRLGRWCGGLVHEVIGAMSESTPIADEAIVPYR